MLHGLKPEVSGFRPREAAFDRLEHQFLGTAYISEIAQPTAYNFAFHPHQTHFTTSCLSQHTWNHVGPWSKDPPRY